MRVVDLGVGMAAALTAKLFSELGAHVDRIEPPSGDPFYRIYPAYAFWRSGECLRSLSDLERLLSAADICLVGGEAYPDLDWRHDVARLAAVHPGLIVVEIAGYIAGGHDGPAVDLLVQAHSGLVNEQFPDRPIRFATMIPTYGAALLAHVGLWAALLARDATGRGDIVRVSLQQGIAMFWSQIWMDAERGDAEFDKLPPKGVNHLIFECADGDYIHFVLGVPGALASVYRILGIDAAVDPAERGLPSLARGPTSYFADADVLAPAIRRWKRGALLEAMWQGGIPAEPVLAPGDCWDSPQVAANGMLATNDAGVRGAAGPLLLRAITASTASDNPVSDVHQALPAGPLGRVRIVDLGNFIAGPVASKHLADLGAEVIKVEPLGGLANLTGLRNLWACNRGKRSIIVDAKSLKGAEILSRLCRRADVVHHNFRLGVAERLGVDPESLRRLRPDMVTLQTRSYGAAGPKAGLPGFDMIMQALCGHESRAGGVDNPPLWYRSAIVDYATGALGAIGMMVGLFARNRCGLAVEAETSLLGSAIFLMSELIQQADGRFAGAEELDHERSGTSPIERLYKARDGWIAVAARSDQMAQQFALVLNVPATGPSASWGVEVGSAFAAAVEAFDRDELLAKLKRAGVWAEPCAEEGWAAMREDTAARAAHAVIEVDDDRYGRITSCFGPLVNFAKWSPAEFRSAPVSGSDTTQILQELGYSSDEIDDFYRLGCVA